MTGAERVEALHRRMDALRQRREHRKTAMLGAGSTALFALLVGIVFGGGASPGGTAGMYTGAAMLFENAGGYVLAAVLAFMAGVVITVLCIRHKKKDEKK